MSSSPAAVVIGIDVGTSGVRALAASAAGDVVAEAEARLSDSPADGSRHEQDPHDWWRAVCQTVRSTLTKLRTEHAWASVVGITVTSTSGSLVLADGQGVPVRPALLYDDCRGAEIAEAVNRRLPTSEAPLNSSYSLIKAAWVRQEEPAVWEKTSRLRHPADWLTGKLSGQFETADYSNALKLGYDFEASKWGRAASLLKLSPDLPLQRSGPRSWRLPRRSMGVI